MVKKNDVFMIGWEYPPHNSGGLGVACQGLTQALSSQNTQIYFTLPYQTGGAGVSHMNLIECTHPNWKGVGSGRDCPPFAAYAASTPLKKFDPLNASDLAALPQSELEHKVNEYAEVVSGAAMDTYFKVIHAHDWMSFPAAEQVKDKTGRPFVAHVHSTEFDRIPHGGGSDFIKQAEYRGMQLADRVIAVSYYTKQLLVDKYSVPADKIDVVHNGMLPSTTAPDPGSHHFAQKRPVIAFMGRLTGQKGPLQFVWLAEQLVKRIPNALFVIAGSGDMYHELLLRTAEKGLSTSVLFSGFVRDTQREKLLNRADVFVMPSLSEPFGLVALEAAERHTPVIISKTSGVSEVLPSALAVDFWDVDQMASTITQLIGDSEHHSQVKNKQLHELKDVTWDRAAQKIRKIYRSAFTGS